jgi:CRP-like cAMP-binding protein
MNNILKMEGVSSTELDKLLEHSTIGIYLKDDFFIKENSMSNKVGIVTEGALLSCQYINEKEVVNNFFIEEGWIGNIDGYYGLKNTASIISCTSSKVAWMDSVTIRNILKENEELKKIEERIIHSIICNSSNQNQDFKSLSPLERYQKLMQEKPFIFQRFSNIHIASYLGVSPETLSRIKGRNKDIS